MCCVRSPSFYNTLTTNCTTNIWMNTRVNAGRVPLSWKILASGHVPDICTNREAWRRWACRFRNCSNGSTSMPAPRQPARRLTSPGAFAPEVGAARPFGWHPARKVSMEAGKRLLEKHPERRLRGRSRFPGLAVPPRGVKEADRQPTRAPEDRFGSSPVDRQHPAAKNLWWRGRTPATRPVEAANP